MAARVRSGEEVTALRRTSALLVFLLSVACAEQPPQPPASAADAVRRLLAAACTARRGALDGAILGFTETREPSGEARKVLAALAKPDRLRLEYRGSGGAAVVCLARGGQTWVGPAGGPFSAASKARVQEIERLWLLLGSLLCWDLTDSVTLHDRTLASKASWFPRAKDAADAPVIRRVLRLAGDGIEQRMLIVGGAEYRIEGSFRGAGGRIPDLTTASGDVRLTFDRYDLDTTFRDGYFRPDDDADGTTIEIGGELHWFKKPRLIAVEETLELEVADPGSWPERYRLLDRLGRQLFDLGQESAGLPVYTTGARIVIPFRPTAGKPRVPDGLAFTRRPAHHALALSAKAPWNDAVESLERRLKAHAAELELTPEGAVRLRPYVNLSGEPPAADSVVTVRGLLRVR